MAGPGKELVTAVRALAVVVVLIVIIVAVVKGSSKKHASDSSTDTPCNAACMSVLDNAPDSTSADVPAPVGGLDATTYDTESCVDWLAADAVDQQSAAVFYMTEFNDPQPVTDLDSIVSVITTVCTSYGGSETPRDAAKVSISTVYGS